MHRLVAVLSLACALSAADRWIEFRSGPFEVATNAGPRAGRDRLFQLEQFRYGVEQLLGRSDLRPVWPIRIVVSRSAPEVAPTLTRDAFAGVARPEGPLSRALLRECARILIESGPARLPDDVEQGLADLFSTVEFKGSQMILGAPPPQAERNRNWAKMHMLGVTPDYYGRLRTLIFNLERGVDPAPAYRNAFGKSPSEIDKEADAYFRAGNFQTTPLRRRPIDPEKEFKEQPVEAARVPVLLADATKTRAAYEAILKDSPSSPEALEGLGLFARAVEASSTSARAWLEYARLEPDHGKAVAALEKAAKLNPRWMAPLVEMAQREPDAARSAQLLDRAAKLASESPRGTRSSASDPRGGRCPPQGAGGGREEAPGGGGETRTRGAASRSRMASIQAALDKANQEHPAIPPASGKVEPWWDDPQSRGQGAGRAPPGGSVWGSRRGW